MTDKNVVRGGLYKHSTKGGKCVASCTACVYEEGRNDERERCAKIAEDHALLLNSPGEAAACREVAEMIRGGQDGE